MLAHAARWAFVSMAGVSVETGALVACLVVGTIVTPIADRLRILLRLSPSPRWSR
jgi:hypothetical protein